MASKQQTQVHVRFADDVVKLIDARAKQMEAEARKIAPGIEFSRADVVEAIVTQVLVQAESKGKKS